MEGRILVSNNKRRRGVLFDSIVSKLSAGYIKLVFIAPYK